MSEIQRLTDALNVAQAVATKHRIKHEQLAAENARLRKQVEQLRVACKLALTTPGMIKGRDTLRSALSATERSET